MTKAIYGGWITPKGELIELETKLTHSRYCDYSTAHDDGWIGILNGVTLLRSGELSGIGLRFNPRTVTIRALIAAGEFLREAKTDEIYLENAFTEPLPGFTSEATKKDARDFLRRLRFHKKEHVQHSSHDLSAIFAPRKST